MTVICPRCQSQCGDDDTYCFRCGTILPGASGRSAAADSDTTDDASPVEPAATWPSPGETPGESTGTAAPPSPSSSATGGDDEPDFVPLQFESTRRGPEGPRRWLLLGAVLLALLATGAAAALIWQNAGDDDGDDVPQVALDLTPTADARSAVIATPASAVSTSPATAATPVAAEEPSVASPTARVVASTPPPAAVTGFSARTPGTPSNTGTPAPATPVATGTAEPTVTPEPSPTSEPVATPEPTATPTVAPTATSTPAPTAVSTATDRRAALADVALLPSGVLRSLAASGATPPATPEDAGATPPPRGDGTGGVILLPADSTALPAGDGPQQTPATEAD